MKKSDTKKMDEDVGINSGRREGLTKRRRGVIIERSL